MRLPRIRAIRLVGALYAGLVIGYLGLLLLIFLRGEVWRADFTNYYTGAVLVRDGYGSSLYDPGLQARYQQKILGGRHLADGLLPYNHPPHLAILLSPLAILPLEQAYAVWTALNVAVWMGFLWDVSRFARQWGRATRWLAVGMVAALPGVFLSLALGATTILSTVSIWGFYRALKARREVCAGLWLTLGSIRPQIILFPLLMLVGGRYWRALYTIILCGVLLTLLCGFILGWGVWPGFVEMIRQTAEAYRDRYMVAPVEMVNLKALLTLLLGEAHFRTINLITWIGFPLAALFVLGVWFFFPWQPEKPGWELSVSLTISLGLFFNPHAHQQDGLTIAVPGLLLYSYMRSVGLPASVFAMAAGVFPVLWLLDAFFWRPNPVPLFGTLALVIWAIHLLWQSTARGYPQGLSAL